jgi:hypothetical protein
MSHWPGYNRINVTLRRLGAFVRVVSEAGEINEAVSVMASERQAADAGHLPAMRHASTTRPARE